MVDRPEDLAELTSEQVLSTLRTRKDELRQLGVQRIGLFGSFVRGTMSQSSDLDFLEEFEPKTFDAYMDVKEWLEQKFGRPVGLRISGSEKAHLVERIHRETVYAEGF